MAVFSLMLTTTRSRKEAERMARALLSARLAACCSIIPRVDSLFRWKGRVCSGKEAMLLVKTRSSLTGKAAGRIREMHSYEMPSIEVLPFRAATKAMERWLTEETR